MAGMFKCSKCGCVLKAGENQSNVTCNCCGTTQYLPAENNGAAQAGAQMPTDNGTQPANTNNIYRAVNTAAVQNGAVQKSNSKKAVVAILASVAVICVAAVAFAFFSRLVKYNSAIKLFEQEKYKEAVEVFSELGNYKDSANMVDKSRKQWMSSFSQTISAGYCYSVALKKDGTVVAVGSGSQCDVSDWKDIVAISAGEAHTVGLKSNGTVVAGGANEFGQCNVSDWVDIVAISAGVGHTVGLKKDGTVVVTGARSDLFDGEDIKVPGE